VKEALANHMTPLLFVAVLILLVFIVAACSKKPASAKKGDADAGETGKHAGETPRSTNKHGQNPTEGQRGR